jgi:hypothetical protein
MSPLQARTALMQRESVGGDIPSPERNIRGFNGDPKMVSRPDVPVWSIR